MATGHYEIPIGKANLVREGNDVSIITYGAGVHWAEQLCTLEAWDIDILDLRTLNPLDYGAIEESVKKTGKVLVLHEATMFGGIGGEISAHISENLFDFLDAPVVRCASLDTPIPFNKKLEDQFLAKSTFKKKLKDLLDY